MTVVAAKVLGACKRNDVSAQFIFFGSYVRSAAALLLVAAVLLLADEDGTESTSVTAITNNKSVIPHNVIDIGFFFFLACGGLFLFRLKSVLKS